MNEYTVRRSLLLVACGPCIEKREIKCFPAVCIQWEQNSLIIVKCYDCCHFLYIALTELLKKAIIRIVEI